MKISTNFLKISTNFLNSLIFAKAFEGIKEGFREFSTLLTMEQLWRAKDEITDYGQEKIDELQECIKKRPLLTAVCALGAGLLLGTLLKIRK